jgi:DNA polymerase-3 subunit epsilon
MREIVLDTETTGLDPAAGHRLVEIGCIEILNLIPTRLTFHAYLDPQRDMPEEAFRIHGLSADFLTGKPVFADVVDDFLGFLGDARLIIHNAEFDMRFLNAELERSGRPLLGMDRVVDTLAIARRKYPGSPNSLDALCSRYRIDNSRRTKHGALLDAEILAEVYAELAGGRQAELILANSSTELRPRETTRKIRRPAPLRPSISDEELDAHRHFIAGLGEKAVWRDYVEG